MKYFRRSGLAACMLLLLYAAGPATAQTFIINDQPLAQRAGAVDITQAKPLPMPIVRTALPSPDLAATAAAAANAGPSVGESARVVTRDARHLERKLAPPLFEGERAEGDITPQAYGTADLHFTTSRSSPGASFMKQWPLRATGRLFFDSNGDGQLNSWCSASMIRAGVLVTAGHCLNSGAGTWYSQFTYVPGYRDGSAPYGVWSNWSAAYITTDWLTGGGGVPNQRDWGFVVYNPDLSGLQPGNYTGWLGWWTARTIGRHVTTVGYPGNMYGGEAQMRTDSLTYDVGSAGNAWWGSDQRGGSSGSPLVVNLRNGYNNTAATPSENEANRVSGVISWGYVSTSPMAQGASSFDSEFATMMSNMCTWWPTVAC